MKVDLLPATIMLILGLWKTLHMLLFGWDKGQFYPEKGLSGWHFLIRWLCSLLMSDLLMLGDTSKIVLPQGFNCSLPNSVRYAQWFIIIQIDSLPLSAWLLRPASQPPRRSALDQRSRESTWSKLVSSQAAFLSNEKPAGLEQLTRVNWIVPSLQCHKNKWLSPCMWEMKRWQQGQGRAALLPWEAVNVTPSTLTCYLGKVTSWR